MLSSGRIFYIALFSVLYFCDSSHAIYDPRDTQAVKPPKQYELGLPWYLSNDNGPPPVNFQSAGWDQSSDSTPRSPVIVNDGARRYRPQYNTVNGVIEQESIASFDDIYKQDQNINGNFDLEQINNFDQSYVNTDQNYAENGWFVDNDDSEKPYEDFASEIKKPYKDMEDFTAKPTEVIKIAKYDSATGAQCPTPDATGQFVYLPDCKFFVNCWNGRAFVQPCAPGTLFNPETLECDFPMKVKCYGKEVADLIDAPRVPSPPKKQSWSTGSQGEWSATSSNNNPSCPSFVTGLLPHPYDCKKFLQCANGATFIMDCGPGTVFNPAINNCDWPYNVRGCGGASDPEVETTTVPYWEKIDIRGDFKETPEFAVQPEEVKCSDGQNGLLPHPRDCKKFLQCAHGTTYIMDCGPGTVFNPAISNCDWPYNVEGCTDALKPKPKATTVSMYENIDVRSDFHPRPQFPVQSNPVACPNGREGLLPHPNNCKKFLQCSNGNTNVMDCGPGTVFNPVVGTCDFPYNVEGCGEEKQTVTESSPPGMNPYDQHSHRNGQNYDHNNHYGGQNTNWNKYNNQKNHYFGQTTESSYRIPSNGNWSPNNNQNNPNRGHSSNNDNLEGSYSGVTQNPFNPYDQTTPDQNTYVDSNFKLPNEDAEIPIGYENHGREFPTANPLWLVGHFSTTTENIRNDRKWNQEETNVSQPGKFKPSSWRGHGNGNENQNSGRPTNSPVERPWLQGKIDPIVEKTTDRELDRKLDQWATKTNVFQQVHNNKPTHTTGTKTLRKGKNFSVIANTANTNNSKNQKLFPSGIYVNVNGTRGHFITKEIEINQGHSKTRQYGNKNIGNPNNLSVGTTSHTKLASVGIGVVSNKPNYEFNNPKPGTNPPVFDTDFTDKTDDLSPTEAGNFASYPEYTLEEKVKPIYLHAVNNHPKESHARCNLYENEGKNCVSVTYSTERGSKSDHTTDKNIPYTEIGFDDNNANRRKELIEAQVENTTEDSLIVLKTESIPSNGKNHVTNNRKPKLISGNNATADSKTSVIMKINDKKNDLNIFGVELIQNQEEPPFPVSYVPPVQPINYVARDTGESTTPVSGQVLRLRGGSFPGDGYLEVQGDQPGWGVVCDRSNQWTLKEANVVCRQLGYTGGAEMAWQGRTNSGNELYWIAADSVRCLGNETYFQSCQFTHDTHCDVTRYAVGIRCSPNRVAYCKQDEIPHRGFCYHLADSSSSLNHAEALDYCNEKGSKLLDITDQNENNFISEWLVHKYPNVSSVMTSGFGFTTLNRTLWLWEDSQHAKFRFNKWWPGWMSDKPALPLVGIRPACVVMKRNYPCHNHPEESCKSDYFFWDTEDCAASSQGHSYICKRPYNDIGCVYGKGQHYSGNANVTATGTPCLPWGDESLQYYLKFKVVSPEARDKLKEHNYCRNPNPNGEITPWCYTGSNGEYDYCDIPSCAKLGTKKSVAAGQCKPKHFECTPGECIPSPWICDGEEDCTNGADEQACFQHLDIYTKVEKHRLDGYDVEKWLNTPLKTCALRCKEADFTCRSFSHTTDGNICLLSDSNVGLTGALEPSEDHDYYEMNERSVNCSDMFICDNKKCINQTLVCNGKNNCGDRSDENICDLQNLGYEIRLSGSENGGEGRVEVKAWGRWGQVCDDGFGMIAASIVCKELGFEFGAREVRSAGFYGKGETTSFLMDQVKCRGNESSLKECDFDGWGVHNCLPDEAVGIICKTAVNTCQDGFWKCDNSPECIPTPFICDEVTDCGDGSDEGPEHCEAPFELRLSGGSNPLEGRVEVRHHGIWGTVCDDDFSKATATVICRSLGYGGGATAIKDGAFGPGEGPIWLDEVSCQGNETQLYRCDHEPWGRSNCGHDEDVGVRCEPGEVIIHEHFEDLAPELPEIAINDILPADCGMRAEDFDEDDEYMARVVQGSIAPKGAYPWQASLRVRGHSRSSHWCGAVVISPLYVLTAAHCLEGYNKGMYFVRAGDFNTEVDDGTEVEANIEDYYIHEDFRKGQRMNNDIALVMLKGRGIPLGKNIMPICLPPENIEYLPGLNCTISGWGSIESGKSVQSNFLRFGWIPILDQSVCRAEYVYGEGAISDGMVCAGYLNEGVDSCDGDSGGPLACYHNNAFTLYGITSWGKHCGAANKPGVYVRIGHYRRWIDQKIRESSAGR